MSSTTTPHPAQRQWLWMAAIVLIAAITCSGILSGDKQFTNWDDDQYITDQPLIASLNGPAIQKMFDPKSVVVANYHPLTLLSLALDYQRGYDPDSNTLSITPFAQTSFVLHLINTLLVFLFLYRLLRGQLLAAAIAALLFGIHPLHVESIAWMSERKDLLYCFFFLLSCLAYLRYLDSGKALFLGLSILAFIASCLSKAMAVPLPFILLLTDYLYHRKITAKVMLEKLPYLLIAVVVGLYTLRVQQVAMADAGTYSLLQRILLASGAWCRYWFQLLVPMHLSAYYPYPDIAANGALPAWYYAAPVIGLALLLLPLWLVRRYRPERFRLALWCMGFFVGMIALVLPLLSVGTAITADRYTYVSSVGFFLLLPVVLQPLYEQAVYRKPLLGIGGAILLLYAVLAARRIPVWDNSGTLWSDVVAQYPMNMVNGRPEHAGAKTAYKNLADYYAGEGQYDSAYYYYQPLIAMNTPDAEVWSNVANVYVVRKDTATALKMLNQSIALDSTNYETFLKRAIVLANGNNYPEAVRNLDQVLRLNPSDTQVRSMRLRMMQRIR